MTAERLNIISLVEGCKKNDRKSQHIIYEKFYGKMMGVALRYFKDYDTASDMVQESFIKAFSKINQFEGGENFGGWLKRIVVNHSLDQIRKNKKFLLLVKMNFNVRLMKTKAKIYPITAA